MLPQIFVVAGWSSKCLGHHVANVLARKLHTNLSPDMNDYISPAGIFVMGDEGYWRCHAFIPVLMSSSQVMWSDF